MITTVTIRPASRPSVASLLRPFLCVVALLCVAVFPALANADYMTFVNSLGPTAYYRLNETAVGTVFDSSGNGNDAIHAPGVTAAQLNQSPAAVEPDTALRTAGFAVDLSGVEGSALVSGSQDFSVSMWVEPDSFGGGDYGTFFFMGQAAPLQSLILAEDGVGGGGHIRPGRYAADLGPVGGRGNIAMDVAQWNHVGATYDAASETFTLYVNGELDFSAANVTLSIGSGASSLGSLGHTSDQRFDGQIDEFAFFRTVLSAEDMQNLANAAIPEPSSGVLLGSGIVALLAGCYRRQRRRFSGGSLRSTPATRR